MLTGQRLCLIASTPECLPCRVSSRDNHRCWTHQAACLADFDGESEGVAVGRGCQPTEGTCLSKHQCLESYPQNYGVGCALSPVDGFHGLAAFRRCDHADYLTCGMAAAEWAAEANTQAGLVARMRPVESMIDWVCLLVALKTVAGNHAQEHAQMAVAAYDLRLRGAVCDQTLSDRQVRGGGVDTALDTWVRCRLDMESSGARRACQPWEECAWGSEDSCRQESRHAPLNAAGRTVESMRQKGGER